MAGRDSQDTAPPQGASKRRGLSQHPRVFRFAQAHPKLYAARHFGKLVAEILIVLGVMSLLGALLPAINLPLPDIDLPDVSLPTPNINLPDINLPAWVGEVLKWGKFVVLFLIGVFFMRRELKKSSQTPSSTQEES